MHVQLVVYLSRWNLSIAQSINGTNTATTALFKVSDGDLKKVYVNGTVYTNGVRVTEETLQDFTTSTQYTVINGKCYKTPIPLNLFMNCLPSDAKLVLSTYYGFGEKKIDVHVYTFRLNGMEISVTVTPFHDTCILVSEHVSMRTGIIDIGFMGTTMGIKDPSVLNIPKQCQEQTTLLVDDHIIMKHTTRRHSILFS